MSTIQTVQDVRRDLLSRLTNVREKHGYWVALCPSHEDHNPSLSVREMEDGVSVKCHAGCDTEAILAALGKDKSYLYPQSRLEVSPSSKRSEYYYYESESGDPLFRVWRTPSKKFIQQRFDRETGSYRSGLGDVGPVLYRLPELLQAPPSEPVFVVEGEKDTDRLIAEGLVATTSPMGAGKWREGYARYFEGREVYVIPDNDEQGKRHAQDVARSTDAKILRLPDLPAKGDVSDWLDRGHRADKLLELAQNIPSQNGHVEYEGLEIINWADLLQMEFPPVKWIVPDLIPQGTMIFAGRSKMGKSWFALGLCIAVATGGKALGEIEVEQGDVLYLALEDNAKRTQTRSKQIRGEVEEAQARRLDLAFRAGKLDSSLLGDLRRWIGKHPEARLIVIDTLQRIKAKAVGNRTLYSEDYEVGEELLDLANENDLCIIVIHHLNQQQNSGDALQLISGSEGLIATFDGAMVLDRVRSQADAILKVVHRDLEDDPEVALCWNSETGTWEYIGDADEFRMSKERREIFDVLATHDEDMKPAQIAEAIGRASKDIYKTLQRMRDDGQIDSTGWGAYRIAKDAVPPAKISLTPSPISPNVQSNSEVKGEIGQLDTLDRGSGEIAWFEIKEE